MVSVVQWLEHWIVVPVVGGSSPLAHPMIFCSAACGDWVFVVGTGKKKRISLNPNPETLTSDFMRL